MSLVANKRHYDRKHQPLHIKVGDHVLLRLHKGYHIPSTKVLGSKLSQQYAGPFRVLEKIGNLPYRLDFPRHWRVHIKPVPDPSMNPYHCPCPDEPEPVHIEGDTETVKSFEIDRLINRRILSALERIRPTA